MSYRIRMREQKGYFCNHCGIVTGEGQKETHVSTCDIAEARRRTFLEAAEIVDDWGHDQRPGTHRKMAEFFRARAEEAKN